MLSRSAETQPRPDTPAPACPRNPSLAPTTTPAIRPDAMTSSLLSYPCHTHLAHHLQLRKSVTSQVSPLGHLHLDPRTPIRLRPPPRYPVPPPPPKRTPKTRPDRPTASCHAGHHSSDGSIPSRAAGHPCPAARDTPPNAPLPRRAPTECRSRAARPGGSRAAPWPSLLPPPRLAPAHAPLEKPAHSGHLTPTFDGSVRRETAGPGHGRARGTGVLPCLP